jgi:hypothetical protein
MLEKEEAPSFAPKDKAVLAVLADSFAATTTSQSAEQFIETLLSTCPLLKEEYTEIGLLALLMEIRRRCRFASAGDRSSFAALADLLDSTYSLLPDRAFALLAGLVRSDDVTAGQLGVEGSVPMKVLRATFLLASRVQADVLRSTHSLTRRSDVITVNVFDLPFLA